MPQQEYVPKSYQLNSSASPNNHASVHLQNNEQEQPIEFSFEAIKPGLFRTTFSSKTHPLPPFPSAARPKLNSSAFKIAETEDSSRTFECGNVEAKVDWTGVPIVSVGFKGQEPLHADLPFRSYAIDGK